MMWHSATPMNHDYTEEYASYYHHEMLKIFETRPWVWGTHVWNCFDFAADTRDEGGVKERNNKGLITYDRKTKKDAFYIYKAYWNPEPMIYIASRRFAIIDLMKNDECIQIMKGWLMQQGALSMVSTLEATRDMMGTHSFHGLSMFMDVVPLRNWAQVNRMLNKIKK